MDVVTTRLVYTERSSSYSARASFQNLSQTDLDSRAKHHIRMTVSIALLEVFVTKSCQKRRHVLSTLF